MIRLNSVISSIRRIGEGLRKESCLALIELAFSQGVHRIFAQCDLKTPIHGNYWNPWGLREAHLKQNVYFERLRKPAPLEGHLYLRETQSSGLKREADGAQEGGHNGRPRLRSAKAQHGQGVRRSCRSSHRRGAGHRGRRGGGRAKSLVSSGRRRAPGRTDTRRAHQLDLHRLRRELTTFRSNSSPARPRWHRAAPGAAGLDPAIHHGVRPVVDERGAARRRREWRRSPIRRTIRLTGQRRSHVHQQRRA